MKRITLIILAAAAVLAGSVSCQKVNDIDKRLTQLEQTVSDLKAQVLAGAVITSVEKTEDGCTFVLSNGQAYKVTNGKDGSDGEAIIADVKIEENFIVLTLKDGETLRISYQNPLSMVTLNIIPDFSDGSVYSFSDDGSFFLRVSVTPEKYIEKLIDNDGIICKADFRSVITKAIPEDPDFTVVGEVTSGSVEEGYMTAYFDLSEDEMAKLQESDYMVSFSVKDRDGTHGATTSYVPMSYQRVGQGGDIEMPEGALPGLFTVAPNGKQVYFSQGNLWYGKLTDDAAEATWNLEENQYGIGLGEIIDNRIKDILPDYYWLENHVSHFYWASYPSEAYVLTSANEGFDQVLFTNSQSDERKPNPDFTANGQKGIWRVLTLTEESGEWDYLLNRRTMTYGKPRYTEKICTRFEDTSGEIVVSGEYARIDGNEYSGLFIYPDDYDGNEIGTEGAPDTWREINEVGIVFLPAAGNRRALFEIVPPLRREHRSGGREVRRPHAGEEIRNVGRRCAYWASGDTDEFIQYFFDFERVTTVTLRFDHHKIRDRYIACCSIRLVTDAN